MSNDSFAITGATIVTPDRVIENGALVVRAGRIDAVLDRREDLPSGLASETNVDGALLIPGIVDLHNDSLETEVNPRPGANLPVEFALANFERRLLASGVTAEFHAISFMNMAKSNRTVGQAAERTAFIAANRDRRIIDHHVLHRLDVWNPEALDALFASLRTFPIGSVSLNDHTPGQGQYRDVARYTEFMTKWRRERGHAELAKGEVEERMAAHGADTTTIPSVFARVKAEREAAPFVLSTHDDDSPEKVDRQWEIGATIAEFPVTMEAARRAHERGMSILVGAPNIVRGGSTSGNMDARELFSAGLANIICADYHAPSLLVSALKLAGDGITDLPTAVRALTLNPATAMGLEGTGAIREGFRADMVLAHVGSDNFPHIEAVYRDGREVFALRQRTAMEVQHG